MSSELPIVENPFAKHPAWKDRNSYLIRGMSLPSGVVENGVLRTTSIDYNWAEVVPGGVIPAVRCKTYRFSDVGASLEDGAEVAVRPGKLTPPQHISSEATFSEVPLRGKLIFLSVSPVGIFSSHFFEVHERQNSPFMAQVTKGWVMSWYACLDPPYDGLFMEHEIPGFSQAQLPTVPDYAPEFNGTPIPEIFWATRAALAAGVEKEILANCFVVK